VAIAAILAYSDEELDRGNRVVIHPPRFIKKMVDELRL